MNDAKFNNIDIYSLILIWSHKIWYSWVEDLSLFHGHQIHYTMRFQISKVVFRNCLMTFQSLWENRKYRKWRPISSNHVDKDKLWIFVRFISLYKQSVPLDIYCHCNFSAKMIDGPNITRKNIMKYALLFVIPSHLHDMFVKYLSFSKLGIHRCAWSVGKIYS